MSTKKTLAEWSKERTFHDFHDAKVEAKKGLKENDPYKTAMALGEMVANFGLVYSRYNKMLDDKSDQKPSS